ncbi:MAG TPA: FAD-binding oxidoreductase [Polyangiaceae bacterium]|jgi:NAD(P)H-flavin reductase
MARLLAKLYDPAMPAQGLTVELIARTPLSGRVDRLRFAARGPFRWAAGQHLVVVKAKGQALFLPYSIASAYDRQRPGQFELAAAVGAGADVIDQLSIGEELQIEGPSGAFVWQSAASPAALLVGAGTGVAPLRALLEEELARTSQTRLILIAGHRAPEDVLFGEDFARLARQHARFRFVPTLTSASAAWPGERGRVQAQLRAAVQSLGPLDAYVCGRPAMVNEVVAALEQDGVPAARIRSEGF